MQMKGEGKNGRLKAEGLCILEVWSIFKLEVALL